MTAEPAFDTPDYRAALRDPDCHLCDIDRHVCPGCGASIAHGTAACDTCNAIPDAVVATVASNLNVQFAQPDVTPAEVATAQVLDDLPAPPAAVDLDQLADPAPLAWYTAIEDWDAEIANLEDQIAPLKEKRERASEIIQAAMGDAEEARIKGRPVVTWKTSKPAQRLDRKALEAAYGADVIARFLVDNKAARPFKILPRRGGAR